MGRVLGKEGKFKIKVENIFFWTYGEFNKPKKAKQHLKMRSFYIKSRFPAPVTEQELQKQQWATMQQIPLTPSNSSSLITVLPRWPSDNKPLDNQASIPESGRLPGGGHDNLLQYSCLENPMDRGAWWAIQSMGSQSQTQLK